MPNLLLGGDTALVTGAASGIGRGVARALAAEGARVVASDMNARAGAAIAQEIGGPFIAADLSQPDALGVLFDATVAALGNVSVFVHCASPRRHEAETVPNVTRAQWDPMVDTNLRAGFLLGHAAGRHMRDAGLRGRMLFMTSRHAYAPRNLAHYSASKAGLTMLMKELGRALGPYGIRVDAIAPGSIPGGGSQISVAVTERMIPLGRTGTPEDIAGMAVALLCDRFSAYVTGTRAAVGGGMALYSWIPAAS